MLLVLCVDLDDDLGRKTDFETPVVGRDSVEAAAVALANADPEDSDVNVCFQGVHLHDDVAAEGGERVEVAVVTGTASGDVAANRAVGEEVDTVLAALSTSEDVRALVVTDGAQDESVLPVIRSRVPIDGVRRVVVRQAQDLESIYYTFKQVLADPETRGTILVPLGILLLIYPVAVIAEQLDFPGSTLGIISALLGLYVLFRGLGLEGAIDDLLERVRVGLFSGRVQLITSVVGTALVAVGAVGGLETMNRLAGTDAAALLATAAFVYGAVQWVAAAGVAVALGRITDGYLDGSFRWRHLNAPFYVVAIAIVLHGLTAFFVQIADPSYLAATLSAGTLLGLASTLAFALVERRFPPGRDLELIG